VPLLEQRKAILALRKGEHGGVNFTPAVSARGWNRALIAVAETLGLGDIEPDLRRLLREDDEESHRRVEAINARERARHG
jgi:hypothetical protein